jgi:hypothetical protein
MEGHYWGVWDGCGLVGVELGVEFDGRFGKEWVSDGFGRRAR